MIAESTPKTISLNDEIDSRINSARRPDRYNPDNDAECQWLDDIASEIEVLIPEKQARAIYAKDLVHRREGQAGRRTNDLHRTIFRTQQPLLDLELLGAQDWPLSVAERKMTPDGLRNVRTRVALRAATVDDLSKSAVYERREAAQDFSARNDACSGKERVADEMEEQHDPTWLDWAVRVSADGAVIK